MNINRIIKSAFHEPEINSPKIIQNIEVIPKAKPANDDKRKRYAYHFSLKNNAGAGTLITNSPPKLAKQEIEQRFLQEELGIFKLLN